MSSKLFAIVGLCVAAWCVPMICVGQVTNGSYSVTHNYTFWTGGGAPTVSRFNYWVSAGAFEPAPGWDWAARGGAWTIVGPGGFGDVAPVGTDRSAPLFMDAGATAGVSATVNNWGGGMYSASMTSYGSAHAQFWPDQAYANSAMASRIWAGWTWRNGRIVWRPVISDVVGGSTWVQGQRWRPIRNRDPIMVTAFDADGDVLSVDSFFDVFLELSGDLDWNETGMHATDPVGTLDFALNIDMDNPHLTTGGQLDLEVIDGMVTTSNATGIFAGSGLPLVGTNVGGVLDLPNLTNEIELVYDFTSLEADSFMFELGGDGSVDVPEPTALPLIVTGLFAGFVIRRRRG